jgi:hypothetical protein
LLCFAQGGCTFPLAIELAFQFVPNKGKKTKKKDVGWWGCPWYLVLSSFLLHGGVTHLETRVIKK